MISKWKLYIFKVYNVILWNTYTLWNNYHNYTNIHIHDHTVTICVCVCMNIVRTFKIYSLNKFQVYNTVLLLTKLAMLCRTYLHNCVFAPFVRITSFLYSQPLALFYPLLLWGWLFKVPTYERRPSVIFLFGLFQ
jgi:hypothetical protein